MPSSPRISIDALRGLVTLSTVGTLWLRAAAVALPCRFACRRFAALKRTSGRWWPRYL